MRVESLVKTNRVKYLVAVLFAVVILALSTACSIVGPGERGVRVSLGKVSKEPQEPGAYLWVPFLLGMDKMDVQIQKTEVESSSASKDMQEITAKIAVNWSLAPDSVVKVYQDTGDEDSILTKIIAPAINESLKSATAQRAAEECLTKRIEMKNDIDKALAARLLQYGITMHDVSIMDLKFGKEFTDAIERKQIAEQEAKQAEYVALKATQEAKAEVERAKGQNEAQKLLQATTSTAILQKAAIDKWDGKFPQVMGSGTLPFLNIKMKE